MRKSIFAILCVLCIFLMAGCSNLPGGEPTVPTTTAAPQQSTYEVVNDALAKTEALDTMDMEMKMLIAMSMQGESMEMPMTVKIKGKNLQSESPVISSSISMTVLGVETNVDMYQEGNWAYITTMGTSYKMNVSAGNQFDYSSTASDMLQDIPEELLKGLELAQNADGSETITLSIPNEMFSEIYGSMIDSMNQSTGLGSTSDISIKDATVKITIDNDFIKVYDMSFVMDMKVTGISVSSSVTASITYENPGQDVTITPPEGYQSFPEISG